MAGFILRMEESAEILFTRLNIPPTIVFPSLQFSIKVNHGGGFSWNILPLVILISAGDPPPDMHPPEMFRLIGITHLTKGNFHLG